jgi:hypothetical protein
VGRLLVELAVATGVGAIALFGLFALVIGASRLDRQAREAALARRAAEGRLAEIAALDMAGFRAALAGGREAAILSIDVPGLEPLVSGGRAGRVAIDPFPGDPGFEAATIFAVRVEIEWLADGRATSVALEALVRPEERRKDP